MYRLDAYSDGIHEKITSTYDLGEACYSTDHDHPSSSLASQNVKIKKHEKSIALPVVLYGYKSLSLTFRGRVLKIHLYPTRMKR